MLLVVETDVGLWERFFTSVLLVKIDKVDAEKPCLSKFQRETGRVIDVPALRPRNPVPEVEGPATDTNARLSIFSSRSSAPSKDGGITTHSPRTDSRVKVNLTDGRGNRQYIIYSCWEDICIWTEPPKIKEKLPTEMIRVLIEARCFLSRMKRSLWSLLRNSEPDSISPKNRTEGNFT